jgi:hypothetical protein
VCVPSNLSQLNLHFVPERMGIEFFFLWMDRSASSFVIKTGGVLVRFGCLHDVSVPPHAQRLSSNLDGGPPSDASIREEPILSVSVSASPTAPSTSTSKSDLSHPTNDSDNTVKKPTKIKTMAGELEVAVMPDLSHRFFVGQRTIVRFRLVG